MTGGEHHPRPEAEPRQQREGWRRSPDLGARPRPDALDIRARRRIESRSTDRWPDVSELGQLACLSCAREGLRALWPGPRQERPSCTRPEDLVGVVMPLLAGRDREHGLLLALDTKYRLIDVEQVSVGTANHTFLAPREVYRDALLHGATAIALAHNHPSGDPSPSAEDVGITERLARAGSTLGVELIDHLVVGSDGAWTSLAREGLL